MGAIARRGRGEPVPSLHVSYARELIRKHGVYIAADMIGMHSTTIVRVAAGLTVRSGTIAQVEAAMATEARRRAGR